MSVNFTNINLDVTHAMQFLLNISAIIIIIIINCKQPKPQKTKSANIQMTWFKILIKNFKEKFTIFFSDGCAKF